MPNPTLASFPDTPILREFDGRRFNVVYRAISFQEYSKHKELKDTLMGQGMSAEEADTLIATMQNIEVLSSDV